MYSAAVVWSTIHFLCSSAALIAVHISSQQDLHKHEQLLVTLLNGSIAIMLLGASPRFLVLICKSVHKAARTALPDLICEKPATNCCVRSGTLEAAADVDVLAGNVYHC